MKFLEKKLEKLKQKYPNIPYVISPYGSIISYKNGEFHSYEDQPAEIEYDRKGIREEKYYKNGLGHREGDKPAAIYYYYGTRKIAEKIYKKNGEHHRDGDKPARIYYYENGKIEKEIYKKNGKLHRDNNKPAFIEYDKNGKIIKVKYYKDGIQYSPLPDIDYKSEDQTRRDLDYFDESLNEDYDFLEKELERLKKKFPNIPYELSYLSIMSKKNGKYHSYEDQPCYIEYSNEKIVKKVWNKNGKFHRDNDKPAYIIYYKNGKISEKTYYKNDKKHRDGDKPTIIIYNDNGKIKEKYWVKNGKLHRDENKPGLILYYTNGKIEKVKYYKNGKEHRDGDKPAIIIYYENGKIKEKVYIKNGSPHRDNDKPAIIWYYEHGKIEKVEYYKNGKRYYPLSNVDDESQDQTRRDLDYRKPSNESLNEDFIEKKIEELKRKFPNIPYEITSYSSTIIISKKNGEFHSYEDQPAAIEYYKNGKIKDKIYYKNGNTHRDNDKPAYISYDEDGKIEIKDWYRNGKKHRDNKPAVIEYDKNGKIIKVEYWKDGKQYHPLPGIDDESVDQTRRDLDYKPSNESLNEDFDFLKKKLEELKQKYPNIPYESYEHVERPFIYSNDKNGKYHSYENQPGIIYYYENEKIYRNIWYKNGEQHRDGDKPAYIWYYENGKIEIKEYCKNGKLHRDGDKPASIKYYENGKIERKKYGKNGKFNRDNNKPAFIWYDENGKIIKVEYWINGKRIKRLPTTLKNSEDQTRRNLSYNIKPSNESLNEGYDFIEKELKKLKKKFPNIPYYERSSGYIVSRKNGKYHSYENQPSIILYYENGKIKEKVWHKNGKRHRDNDRPAVIWYNKNGKIEKVEYWKDGKRYYLLSPTLKNSDDQTRRDLDYKFSNESLNEDSDFLEEKLKELKKKYPNIPYRLSSSYWGTIISKKNNGLHSYEDQPAMLKYYYNNGEIEKKEWYKNDNFHRDGDKPAAIKYYSNGKIEEKVWFKNSSPHRDNDKPAYISYDKNGKIIVKYWYKNGKRHRDGDKPAEIEYYKDGKIEGKIYIKNGKLHRDNDKPAVIRYYKNGKIRKVEYWKNGKQYHPLPGIDDESQNQTRRDLDYKPSNESLNENFDFLKKKLEELKREYPNIPYEISYNHIISKKNEERHSYENQPAIIYYDENGKITEKYWYKNKKQHRSKNKPAVIYYNNDEKIIKVEYWFNGRRIKPLPPILQNSSDQTRRDLDYKLSNEILIEEIRLTRVDREISTKPGGIPYYLKEKERILRNKNLTEKQKRKEIKKLKRQYKIKYTSIFKKPSLSPPIVYKKLSEKLNSEIKRIYHPDFVKKIYHIIGKIYITKNTKKNEIASAYINTSKIDDIFFSWVNKKITKSNHRNPPNTITIAGGLDKETLISALLHEFQHIVENNINSFSFIGNLKRALFILFSRYNIKLVSNNVSFIKSMIDELITTFIDYEFDVEQVSSAYKSWEFVASLNNKKEFQKEIIETFNRYKIFNPSFVSSIIKKIFSS